MITGITLSNGHNLKYMAASGALGYFGNGWPWDRPFIWTGQLDPSLFTVVAKTVTYEPRKGNPRRYWLRLLPAGIKGVIHTQGTVNAVGLANPGYVWWQRKVRQGKGIGSLIASIFSESSNAVQELAYMARVFQGLRIVGIEVNASCPNTEGDVLQNTQRIIGSCEAVKKQTNFPLLLKLSVVHDIGSILPRVERIVEAISINSVPWDIVFPCTRSPLDYCGEGGVSGKIAQKYTWAFAKKITDQTDIPVIWPSVWDYGDMAELREKGVDAISFGSVFLRYPWRPTAFVRKDMAAG